MEKLQEKITKFPFKNIAVLGMGRSGTSALKLLSLINPDRILAINQGEPENWSGTVKSELKKFSGSEKIEYISQEALQVEAAGKSHPLSDYELIVLSPGISRDIDLLKNYQGKIWCEIELAYFFCDQEKIISVTGTNGKTTTVSLIEECLSHSGKSFFVGGNIGIPFCEYITSVIENKKRSEIICLELSSFQLESLFSFHSHIAAILNITFSHGERYDSLAPYAQAKLRIFNNQTTHDLAICEKDLFNTYNSKVPVSEIIEIDYKKIDTLKEELEKQIDLNKLKIVGIHNIKNIYVVSKIWQKLCEISSITMESFVKGCLSFGGVHYRLEYLGKFSDLEVFNDSKSTNWEATETAIIGVQDRGMIYLILGGQKRGHGDKRFEVLLPYKKSIKQVLLIGESGQELFDVMKNEFDVVYVENFLNLKKYVIENKLAGVLLFSPAFPSFDQFKSYVDRGEKFTALFN